MASIEFSVNAADLSVLLSALKRVKEELDSSLNKLTVCDHLSYEIGWVHDVPEDYNAVSRRITSTTRLIVMPVADQLHIKIETEEQNFRRL